MDVEMDIKKSRKREIYWDALRTWGLDPQTRVCIEKTAGLMQALSKTCNPRSPGFWKQREKIRQDIVEGIADVKILLGQMELGFTVEDDVKICKEEKLNRIEKELKRYKHCQVCICKTCDRLEDEDCPEGVDMCDKKCDHESHTTMCPWHPNERMEG